MITPSFTVSQEEDFVTIVIKAPHIKTQNVDFEVDGAVFKFNLKPYFLRLTFPGNVVDDERAKAAYNVGAGELTVVLPKETPGEHFPDLDMLTKLLVRKGDLTEKQQIKRPLIEVISSGDTLEGTQQLDKDEEFDWEMPQEIRQEIFSEVRYGFNNRYSGFFTHVQETANDVLDVYDPEHATFEIRRQNRIKRENDKFDDEYYMNDFMTEEEIQDVLKFKTQWWNELRAIQKAEKGIILNTGDSSVNIKPFSAKEQELMRDLPRREYILENTKSTYLTLIDILFAYSYDLRVSEGDTTVETAWTICKLSPSMAALDQFTTLRETLLASFRRALAYPLSRNWNLAMKVLQDVYVILKLGRRGILRALLAIKDVLDHDDVYYIYSKMFIEDYCVWIQSASEKVVRTLAHELHHFKLEKSELGWHLEELEALAKEAPETGDEDDEEEEDDKDTSSDEDTSSDDDSSSEEDSGSEDDDSEDEDEGKGRDKDKKDEAQINEEESIFIQDGPRPMIVEL
ncbi:SHQ1 protein-domain-containing protein [Dissophora ornata]|nr:SHQ1 protein-domain-containing protein [Dissophora ornata]